MDVITDQSNLLLKIKINFPEDIVIVDQLKFTETISETFEGVVEFHSPVKDIQLSNLIGSKIKVWIDYQQHQTEDMAEVEEEEKKRYFCGKIGKIEQTGLKTTEEGYYCAYYRAFFYPDVWFLKFSKNYRIFQNSSVADIIQTIFDENNIDSVDNQLQKAGQKEREYCVQYGESNFDFISRLMEEEGIFYYFTHDETEHTIVLADSNNCINDIFQSDLSMVNVFNNELNLNLITNFNLQEQVVNNSFKTVDYFYETPSVKLMSATSGQENNFYQYPGLFRNSNEGEVQADIWSESLSWSKKLGVGSSACAYLNAGFSFTLNNHPNDYVNKKYAIYQVKHLFKQNAKLHAEEASFIYKNDFTVFDYEVNFKPLKVTPKNRIYGSQTAFVCGSDEVFSDAMGRVKVQFHWDLQGQNDDDSSCWIRVAQGWSGPGWGTLFTPRVGMEVVVTFIDGDPDRPLITGCVYNRHYMPPYSSGDAPHYSTIKTQTIEGSGANEFRFSDAADAEEIYTHAQKDVVTVIEDSRTETINVGDDTLTIKSGNKTINLNGDGTAFTTNITMGDKTFNITTGDFNININAGDKNLKIGSGNENSTLSSGDKNLTLSAGDFNTTLSAGDYNINLSAGNLNIKLGGGNIAIDVQGEINVNTTDNISFNTLGAFSINALGGVEINTPADVEIHAGGSQNLEAGDKISLTAGSDIEASGGKDINMSAGKSCNAEAGQAVSLSAGQSVDIQGGLSVGVSGGVSVDVSGGAAVSVSGGGSVAVSSGSMLSVDGGLMTSISGGLLLMTDGGLLATHSGGLMGVFEGGLCGEFEGGCSAVVKGASVKIGP